GLDKPTVEHPFISFNGVFWVKIARPVDRAVIKPRELRNILAKEHLKEGDVCVFKQEGKEHIYRVDKISDGNYPYVHNEKHNVAIYFDNFLRYTTDEEKAQLETNKVKSEFGIDEVELGVWYKWNNGCLVVYETTT